MVRDYIRGNILLLWFGEWNWNKVLRYLFWNFRRWEYKCYLIWYLGWNMFFGMSIFVCMCMFTFWVKECLFIEKVIVGSC